MIYRRGMRKLWIAIPLVILAVAVFGFIVMGLWNWLVPALFGGRIITFWQALGILALCRILFGGLGSHGSGRSSFRRRMEERCEHTTPEERERFRQRMRERFGFGPSTSENKGQ